MLQLQVIYGKDAGKCLSFQQSAVNIGTDPGNDFRLTDNEVSEYHGRFTCNHDAGHYAYCDLQSLHGSRVQSSTIDVQLYSHQMPQSIALAGDTTLSVGQTVIRCQNVPGKSNSGQNVSMSRKTAISIHALAPSKNVELLGFLLDMSTHLMARTNHQGVMAHVAKSILQQLPKASHVAFWQIDSVRDSFSCVYERARNNGIVPHLLSKDEFLSALNGHNVELYVSKTDDHQAIVAPLVTSSREIGVFVVASDSAERITSGELDAIARLAHMVAYAFERTVYNADLSSVFEGFIRAMIAVMDARDPATAGHSMRVSQYTMYLAQAIQSDQSPAFKNVSFSHNHIDELRFASLLHDIGKVVLRREILLKSAKLRSDELKHLLERIDLFSAWFATQSVETLGENYRSPQQFEHYREIVTRVVQADVHPTNEDLRYLNEMRKTTVSSFPGLPLLTAEELECLCIPFGTLNADERHEIQKHALISWQYLSQIAWPQRWANVPLFVLQHHEKLNGTGYPYGISGDQILMQSRMISVCDIFDALTGGDRSYKTRHAFGDAAMILRKEADYGALDPDIVDIFIRKVIPQIVDPEAHTNGDGE